jgi:hypothetical protein
MDDPFVVFIEHKGLHRCTEADGEFTKRLRVQRFHPARFQISKAGLVYPGLDTQAAYRQPSLNGFLLNAIVQFVHNSPSDFVHSDKVLKNELFYLQFSSAFGTMVLPIETH